MKCVLIFTVLILSTLFTHAQKPFTQRVAIAGDTMIFTDSAYILPPSILRARLLADKKQIADLKALLGQKSSNSKSVIVWYERETALLREKAQIAEAQNSASDSLLALCLKAQTQNGAKIENHFEKISGELFEIRVRYQQSEIDRQKEQIQARKQTRQKFWIGIGVGAGAALLGVLTLVFAL